MTQGEIGYKFLFYVRNQKARDKMGREILFRAKRIDNERWVEGMTIKTHIGTFIVYEENPHYCDQYGYMETDELCKVHEKTICQYTGLTDKNGKKIFENDITRLILPNDEVRYFKVSLKSVVREVVCQSNFTESTAKAEITGVVFEWNGYELFPVVDSNGISDCKRMVVVGNIFDNPELLEEG